MKFTLITIAVIMSAFHLKSADSAAKRYKAKDIPSPDVGQHIFGGTDAKVNQFAYQAALYMDTGAFCGGSLILSQWILTAAHCLIDATAATVILGSLDSETGSTFESEEIIIHEMYNDVTIEHDIGLIKLSTEAPTKAKNIKTVKLQSKSKGCGNPNKKLFVSGWGDLNTDGDIPTALQWVAQEEITNTECFDSYGIEFIPPTVMCAKGQNSATVCSGDSGGPLVASGFTQVGIVSFGSVCGDGTPSGFTRVALYLDWISVKTGVAFK